MTFKHLLYETDGRIATITLNRPDRLNAIARGMPQEIREAVEKANDDNDIHAIVLTGAGRSFCAGYDLIDFAEHKSPAAGGQSTAKGPWDPMVDFAMMGRNTQDFMSLWRSNKPTIAKVRGHAVAGGSDIALCCDLVVMAEDAKIGYPPARVWGVPTPAMWIYRLGAEKAKRMLLTGDLITGREAADMGLVLEAVPETELNARVVALATRIAAVPKNQLMMVKLVVNQAIESMGLVQTQMFATLFDGIARHSPEGVWFKQQAEEKGFKEAVRQRDSGAPIAEGVSKPFYRF
ncbi:MAG: crotonase/enoyl-CoA hydratase family protein [Alphaproteobacteria bacterium]|nr:crotonase/enoyl-CoA hydratase family protein [Alphaproteobacteria bacterium]